ncbi:MAG: thiol:disulfide interchange protein DsbA/DsbL [Pseudomonadota bacterium]|nr:thiol:disulfide interchange protein DsbA/DsbL [Pseudomonadota bacterium]
MHLIRRLLCTTILLGLAGANANVFAAPAAPQNGNEYMTLPTVQPTDSGSKVEVTEFFAYYCPHCNVFEPLLEAWVKKQGNNIVFKRVHVGSDPRVAPQQRLYYTLEAMNLVGQYHTKAFDAIHKDHLKLQSDDEVFDWAAKAGINRAAFISAYRSFGMPSKLRRADATMAAYKVDHWPMVAIDGKYTTSPSMANKNATAAMTEEQQQQNALMVMDFLVAKAKAEKK